MKHRHTIHAIPLITILTVVAAMIALAVPTTAAPAPTAPSVVDEVARIRGLSTFAKLLDESGVARMIDSMATPKDSASDWFALFAFTDESWEKLAALGAEWRDGTPPWEDPKQLGELMRRHAVGIEPGRFDIQPRAVAEALLEQGSVRTLDEGFLPIHERARDAARVRDAHVLENSAIVVFTIDQVLFPDSTFDRYFPDSTFDEAPVSATVSFPDSTF